MVKISFVILFFKFEIQYVIKLYVHNKLSFLMLGDI